MRSALLGSEVVLFSLQAIAIDPGTHLPKCGVIHLHQMIAPLLHDQFEVIGIVDGELWAHQHVFNAEQFPGLGIAQPGVSCQYRST